MVLAFVMIMATRATVDYIVFNIAIHSYFQNRNWDMFIQVVMDPAKFVHKSLDWTLV